MGRVDGNYIYDRSGSMIGRIDGNYLYDHSGSMLGRIDNVNSRQAILFSIFSSTESGLKYLIKYLSCLFFFSYLFIFPLTSFAQKKVDKAKNEVLGEGLALYTIILANWTSNDLYYENEYGTGGISGYISYKEKDSVKTIFWREIDTASAEYKAKTFKEVADTGEVAEQHPKKISDLRVITKTFRYEKNDRIEKKCKDQ